MIHLHFKPKLVETLRTYNGQQFRQDLGAGLLVGAMAIPLAIGFGIASIPLVPPAGIPSPAAMGLYTAIIAGFLISALGGSRVQIGGPTGAFIPIVAAIVLNQGLEGLWLATFLAGFILLALGIFKAGTFSRFIPLPVVIGFTSGISVIIALQQIKDLFGLRLSEPLSAETIGKVRQLWHYLPTYDPKTIGASILAFALILLIPTKWQPRMLILLIGSLLLNFAGWTTQPGREGLATIGSTFGHALNGRFVDAIPHGLPAIVPWKISWQLFRNAIPNAFVIAFLAAIESILSALATDKMIKDRHDPDQELMAQGIANCLVPWIGGLPVTGAIARSSANVQSGGGTPVAGMIHSLFLLAVLIVAAPLVSYVPLAILAVIMVHVAYRMFEYHQFDALRRVTRGELAIAGATFVLTVLVDLTYGVAFGLGVAALTMILRLKEISVLRVVRPESDPAMGRDSLRENSLPKEIVIFRIEGVFFYAVADDLPERVEKLLSARPETRVLIFRISKMLSIDFHGLVVLDEVLASLRSQGIHVIFCDAQPHPSTLMHKYKFLDDLGLENLCGDMESSLKRANDLISTEVFRRPEDAKKNT